MLQIQPEWLSGRPLSFHLHHPGAARYEGIQDAFMQKGRIISREPGLTVCELYGTPYEVGLSHGRLFGPEIALMKAHLRAYFSSITHGMGGLGLIWLFGTLARRMEKHTPEHIKEEMRGIADGSGQGYRFIFLLNALDDVLVNMACSAVAVGPARTRDGRLIVGRNLDYPLFYDVLPGLTTVFKVAPDTGRPFVCVGWPGFAGVVTGMNDTGLVLADLTSISSDRRLSGSPALMVNRLALQGSSTLEEAEHAYRKARRTVGKNIMAASPKGAGVFELTAGGFETRYIEDGLLVCTNHFESPSLVKRQGRVKPPPKSEFPASYYSYAFSKERMDALASYLGSASGHSVEDVIYALGREPVANLSTVQSVVFVPEEKRILVAVRPETPVSLGKYMELTGLI